MFLGVVIPFAVCNRHTVSYIRYMSCFCVWSYCLLCAIRMPFSTTWCAYCFGVCCMWQAYCSLLLVICVPFLCVVCRLFAVFSMCTVSVCGMQTLCCVWFKCLPCAVCILFAKCGMHACSPCVILVSAELYNEVGQEPADASHSWRGVQPSGHPQQCPWHVQVTASSCHCSASVLVLLHDLIKV